MRKFAVITGGSRGIGRAICEKLAHDTDYHLLITYQSNEVAARETLDHIKKLGRDGNIVKFDVSNHQSTVEALTQWQNDNKPASADSTTLLISLYNVCCATATGVLSILLLFQE